MLIRLLAATFSVVAAAPVQSQVAHICWVDRVEAEGSGVRVFFAKGAPVRPDEKSVHGELGATLSPANSGHDGCSIKVARKGQELGVKAEAFFFAPGIMTKPEVRSEWIVATRAP